RGDFLKSALTAGLAVVGSLASVADGTAAFAVEEEPLIDTYWGNGCFWHVQHELAKAEKRILGRTDDQLTAYAGYAGAKSVPEGKLCYHNMRGVSDYGKFGAAEVVRLQIPASKVPDFAEAYFKLFVRYDTGAGRVFLDRNDPQDRGGEYRSL
ncbi:unnamed protein product, partial [Discosporangium mesarthrocarpum]